MSEGKHRMKPQTYIDPVLSNSESCLEQNVLNVCVQRITVDHSDIFYFNGKRLIVAVITELLSDWQPEQKSSESVLKNFLSSSSSGIIPNNN